MADEDSTPDPDEVSAATSRASVEAEGQNLEALLQSRGPSKGEGRTFHLEGDGGDGAPPEPPEAEPWEPEELERAARALLKWGGKTGAAVAMKDPAQLMAFSVDADILEEGAVEIAEDMAPVMDDLAPKHSSRGKALEKIATYLGLATSVSMWGGAVAAQVAAEKKIQEEEARRQQEGPNRPEKGGGEDEEEDGS